MGLQTAQLCATVECRELKIKRSRRVLSYTVETEVSQLRLSRALLAVFAESETTSSAYGKLEVATTHSHSGRPPLLACAVEKGLAAESRT